MTDLLYKLQKPTPEQLALAEDYSRLSLLWGLIMVALILIVVFSLFIVVAFPSPITILITLLITCGIEFSYNQQNMYDKQRQELDTDERMEQISLVELKDKIKINDDKMEIEPLSEEYQYSSRDNSLQRTETNTFKIVKVDFYTERPIKLISRNGVTFDMTRDEFEKLKEGK